MAVVCASTYTTSDGAQQAHDQAREGAHTKVSGDVEMLRTGYYDGTPLEGGKIADSQPVDLFAAARRVAGAVPYYHSQQQQKEQAAAGEGTTTNKKNVIAESEPVDLPASTAHGAWRRLTLLRRRRRSRQAAGRAWPSPPPVDVAWEWDARLINEWSI